MINGSEGQFFVGIGGMRCATTWVANILYLHPQVYLSPIKELHYFDHKYRDRMHGRGKAFRKFYRENYGNFLKRIRTRRHDPRLADALEKRIRMKSDADYRDYFEPFRHFRAFGEITPGYARLPEEGFRDIKRLFPSGRIIFGMRDPADRMWSQWHKIRKRKKGRSTGVFSASDRDDFARFMSRADIIERALYDQTLERVFSVFEASRVFTYFYEDLFADQDSTGRFIAELNRFLGLENFEIPAEKLGQRWDPTSEGELPQDLRRTVMDEYRPTIERLQQILGRVPERWLT